jgi:MoxR-like ATPase
VELLRRRANRFGSIPEAQPVVESREVVLELQRIPETIEVHEDLLGYMADITDLSHDDHRTQVGVSPRGVQRLFEASRARAVIEGREYVVPGDIQRIAEPVLAHRLALSPQAEVNDVQKAQVIDDILDEVPVPSIEGGSQSVSEVPQ